MSVEAFESASLLDASTPSCLQDACKWSSNTAGCHSSRILKGIPGWMPCPVHQHTSMCGTKAAADKHTQAQPHKPHTGAQTV